MKYCVHCGCQNTEEARYCVSCGGQQPTHTQPKPPLSPHDAKNVVQHAAHPPQHQQYTPTSPSFSPHSFASPAPPKPGFTTTGLGFLPVLVMLVAALAIGGFSPYGFSFANLSNIVYQFFPMSLLAVGMAVSLRAKGPDFSLIGLFLLGSTIFGVIMHVAVSMELAILCAVLITAGIGLLNGCLATYTPVPALVLTIITGASAHAVAYAVHLSYSGGTALSTNLGMGHYYDYASFLPIPAILFSVGAFLLVLLTRLGKPFRMRQKRDHSPIHMFAYLLGGSAASVAGILYTLRIMVVLPPYLGHSASYLFFLIFICACLCASRVLDNKIAPVLYALGCTIVWVGLQNSLTLAGVSAYIQQVIVILFCIAAAVVALVRAYKEEPRRPFFPIIHQ